jgi:hypothetical protein
LDGLQPGSLDIALHQAGIFAAGMARKSNGLLLINKGYFQ